MEHCFRPLCLHCVNIHFEKLKRKNQGHFGLMSKRSSPKIITSSVKCPEYPKNQQTSCLKNRMSEKITLSVRPAKELFDPKFWHMKWLLSTPQTRTQSRLPEKIAPSVKIETTQKIQLEKDFKNNKIARH